MTRADDYCETPRGRLDRVGAWELSATLGRGTYAHVRLATHTINGRKAACKILPALHAKGLPPPSQNDITDAMEAHKELVLLKAFAGGNIPGVVGLEGIIEEGEWNYIFLSLHAGSLSHCGKLPEAQGIPFFADLLRTIEALHELGISHEDLKRSNILVDVDEKKGRLRPVLADFGFSHFNPNRTHVRSFGGTFDYSSPDKIANREYDPFANDVWSLGIILMKMYGFPHPYLDRLQGHDDQERAQSYILDNGPIWKWRKSQCTSTGVAGFAMGMLERDAKQRYKVEDLLEHPYLKKRLKHLPPKIPLPSDTLGHKVLRPVSEDVLFDLLFLAYQIGEFRLCETPKNFEKRLYGRAPCWPKRFANMLAMYSKKADLEWEDIPLLSVPQRTITLRRTRPIPALKAIHLSPLPAKSPLGLSNKENIQPEDDDEDLPHKAHHAAALKSPRTPQSQARTTTRLMTPVPVKRPKTFGFGRPRNSPTTAFPKKINPNSVSSETAVEASGSEDVPVRQRSRIPLRAKAAAGETTNVAPVTKVPKATKDIRRKLRVNSSSDLATISYGL